MDVSSVSSSINSALAASLQSPARPRTAEQDQQAQQPIQAQSTQQPPQAAQTREAQGSSSSSERQAQEVTEAEKNRPTVNINGQTVGTLVNTTA